MAKRAYKSPVSESPIVVRTMGKDELSLVEQLMREAERIEARHNRIVSAQPEQPGPAAAPEDQAALDIVPTTMRAPGFGERMKKARAAAAKKRADVKIATSPEDHNHLAKHYEHIDAIMTGPKEVGEGLCAKPPAGLPRAIDVMLKRALETEMMPAKHHRRAKAFIIASAKDKRKKMKGKGFVDFLKKAGKVLWKGVKVAATVAPAVAAAVAPEALPAVSSISSGILNVGKAFEQPSVQQVARAVDMGISAAQALPQAAEVPGQIVKGFSRIVS